jgi:hypothetical protein
VVRSRVVVVGGSAAELRGGDFDVVEISDGGLDEISGADVVVLAGPADGAFEAIRDRAPNAVVVVVGESPQPVCEATLFPRARILGVEADVVGDVVDAIVFDRNAAFTAVARCEGERGIDGEFASVPVRVGARGISEILEAG